MLEQSSQRLERIANLTSLAVAALFAVTIPLGYFVVDYSHTHQLLQEQADVAADTISEMIYQQPEFWAYQEHRLIDALSISNWLRTSRNYTVLDTQLEAIVEVGQTISTPRMTASAELTDGENIVGSIRVTTSMKTMLRTTALVSLAGVLAAWLIHYLLKVLPFATLKKVINSLDQSKQSLHSEIEAKQSALEEATVLSKRLRHQATHDSLTNLPNRAYFYQRATAAIENARAGDKFAVLLLDLNRFKEINDSLGHQAGDAALIEVALRIHQALDEDAFLARLGGDEFAILLTMHDSTYVRCVCEKINSKLQHHMVLDGYHIAAQASIGVACYPQHADTLSGLMRRADIAMYQAKASGGLFCFYEESFDVNSPSRLTLTADLRQALDKGELYLQYQPKVVLDSDKLVGVEALLRWKHYKHGFIAPDVFIPLAEASGMINDLSNMVLRMAAQQLSAWKNQGIDINVAVNISARNLQDDNLVPYIKTLAGEYGVAPSELTLEITESNIMIDPDKAQQQILSLSKWGVRIAVDDYGTGYSSLAYLKRLAVNELKIDKSFVLNMLDNAEDRVIVRSTIELAHNLGMSVVAEGIENQGAANLLREFGCELGQGYHYYRPMNADKLTTYLLEETCTPDVSLNCG